jgi:23S rRNA (guanosine2251-2'-O)-methyltransferase
VDVVYGRNPVLEALRAQRPARRLVIADGIREDGRIREIRARAADAGIPIEVSPRRRLDDIAHTEHHQGVAGYFHTRPPLRLHDLLERARTPALLLVLDGIQDPQNLGAISRSAEACAVDGIVLARRHAASLTGAAAKASAGAVEYVRFATVPNLAQALDTIASAGVMRVGLDADASMRYDEFDYRQPVALVVGAEGRGLHQLTRSHCDAIVALPMLGHVGSLNAGAAAAILLYEVQRQRGFARIRD